MTTQIDNLCFWTRGKGFFPHPLWYLGLITLLKAMPVTRVGSRGRCWILCFLCFKKPSPQNKKTQAPPHYLPDIILKGRVLWSKPVRDSKLFVALNCLWRGLAPKLPSGASWEQDEEDRIYGMKQTGEGGVLWRMGHLCWQGCGCWFGAVVGENIREQRIHCPAFSPNTSLAYQYFSSGCGPCRRFNSDVYVSAGVYISSPCLFYWACYILSGHAIFWAFMGRKKKGCAHQYKLFFLDCVFIDFKIQSFQPLPDLWPSSMVTGMQKEEHRSQ